MVAKLEYVNGVNTWYKVVKGNVFGDVSYDKTAILDHKKLIFERSKNWKFSKGITHDFRQKMHNFKMFPFEQNS